MVLWCIILLIFAIIIQVHSQLDFNGFLSIDCGLSIYSSYKDTTGLTYVSDKEFINIGVDSQVSSNLSDIYISREFETVRSFPTGTRNCYTLRSLRVGFKYLIRATFYYANYDNLNKPPIFDIYLGVDFWDTVKAFNDPNYFYYTEIIVITTTDYLQVCLVNKNLGNPFISSLHLRKMNSRIYEYANASTSLILVRRGNLGGSKYFSILRYPYDEYDRWWSTEVWNGTIEISTNSSIDHLDPDYAPAAVMQTAVTTLSTQQPLNLYWSSNNMSTKYFLILHFYEIQSSLTGRREFDIFVNGNLSFNKPIILHTWDWTVLQISGYTNYNVSLKATSNSTLPPLLNAFELYATAPSGSPLTLKMYSEGSTCPHLIFQGDSFYLPVVAAINSVKQYHNITKGWSGDPCLPPDISWSGINCTTSSSITRITSLNLSSSFLTGILSDSIGNLTALQYLILAANDLSGSLPSSLDNLTALKYLDIRANSKILTTLPPELQKKHQNGSLEYRSGDIATPPSRKKNVTIIAIGVGVLLLVITVAIATVMRFKRRKNKRSIAPKQNGSYDHAKNYTNILQGNPNRKPKSKGGEHFFLNFEYRKFSYNDLEKITNGFKNNIGTGGFGSVYLGHLENGLEVAVKMLSQSSRQGIKEFLAEAENLTRARHKNLVLLMGYCIDENCMALVYEYMQEGSLHDKLKGNDTPLSWNQRLRIAYESALGLEYLHKACNPPLIHRDVKTSNILINANLEAKIADFGLSRAFDSDSISHVSTGIVGTPGYLDPEYYLSNQLSAKSDVFSFGVVLLEIITGRPPTNVDLEGGNLVQWVHQRVSGGNIGSIVDPGLENKYDINSVWKLTDLACKCTEFTSSERPNMTVVVTELKESLDLQKSMEEIHIKSTKKLLSNVSQDITSEISYMGGMPAPGPV